MVRLGLLAGAALAAVAAIRTLRRRRPGWLAVTVLAGEDEVRRALGAGPLDALRQVELRTEAAPGGRGVELHARYRRVSSPAARQRLRAALRDTKAQLEAGTVIRADPATHGYRRRTPWGLAQDAFERRAKGIGLL